MKLRKEMSEYREGMCLVRRHRGLLWSALIGTLLIVASTVVASAEAQKIAFSPNSSNILFERLVELFNEVHDNIEVELRIIPGFSDAIPVQVGAGVGPDVFFVHPADIQQWGGSGLLTDLTPYIERDRADLALDQYFPAALDLAQVGDRFYALPYGVIEAGRVLYNADLLAAAGVATPDGDWTWPEYRELARQLTRDVNGDGVIDQFGTTPPKWRTLVHYALEEGGRFFTEALDAFLPDRAPAVNAFEFMATFHHDGIAGGDVSTLFPQGKVAFGLTHLPGAVHFGDLADDNFTVGNTTEPRHVNGARKILVHTNMLGINPNISDERKEAAWAFIKWVNSPEGYARAGSESFGACQLVPARRDVALSEYCTATRLPWLRPELSHHLILEGVIERTPAGFSQIQRTFFDGWNRQVVSGNLAPAAFYDTVIASINERLKQSQ